MKVVREPQPFDEIAASALSAQTSAPTDSIPAKGLKRWWANLVHGNVDRTFERKLDLSFILSPCYTREGGFGICGMATALYRLYRSDSVTQPSDFSLSGSAMLKGVYTITTKGDNYFRGNRSRLSYALQFMHSGISGVFPTMPVP